MKKVAEEAEELKALELLEVEKEAAVQEAAHQRLRMLGYIEMKASFKTTNLYANYKNNVKEWPTTL
jgi:hypothetical protein